MRSLSTAEEIDVGGAPSFLPDPKRIDVAMAARTSWLTFPVPPLPAIESNFVQGSRSVWVFYPQGLFRRPIADADVYWTPMAGTLQVIPHLCQGANPMKEINEVPSYPGHSLFQKSFFFCTIKNVGDDRGVGDIYVETAVDGNSHMAFAKIYSALNAMNASDFLKTRVFPFFDRYGVAIERVFTRKTDEYCGLAPVHPFETVLAIARIQHVQLDRSIQSPDLLCEQFFHVLQQEFFTPELRKRFQQSLVLLQQDLDAFVETYNSKRKGLGKDAQDRPPLQIFLDETKR